MGGVTTAAIPTQATPTTRRVICITRILGAGGPEVGSRVAEELGYAYVDEDIVHQAAASGDVSVAELEDVARHKTFLGRVLENLAVSGWVHGYMAGITAAALPGTFPTDPRTLRALIRRSIEQTADRGNVVIVSHGASYALAGRHDVLRVLVTAAQSTRRARAAAAQALCEPMAVKAVAEDDAGRAAYLRDFYAIEDENATHYDLTLNSDTLSVERMADVIVRAALAP